LVYFWYVVPRQIWQPWKTTQKRKTSLASLARKKRLYR
jgi:hypothetical protein